MNRPSTTAWMARCVIANWGASELWVGGELRKRFVMMVGRLVILAFGWTAPQGVSQVIFSDPVSLGLAKVSGLKQASGLVSSRRNEDVIWTHNDAGHA